MIGGGQQQVQPQQQSGGLLESLFGGGMSGQTIQSGAAFPYFVRKIRFAQGPVPRIASAVGPSRLTVFRMPHTPPDFRCLRRESGIFYEKSVGILVDNRRLALQQRRILNILPEAAERQRKIAAGADTFVHHHAERHTLFKHNLALDTLGDLAQVAHRDGDTGRPELVAVVINVIGTDAGQIGDQQACMERAGIDDLFRQHPVLIKGAQDGQPENIEQEPQPAVVEQQQGKGQQGQLDKEGDQQNAGQ